MTAPDSCAKILCSTVKKYGYCAVKLNVEYMKANNNHPMQAGEIQSVLLLVEQHTKMMRLSKDMVMTTVQHIPCLVARFN